MSESPTEPINMGPGHSGDSAESVSCTVEGCGSNTGGGYEFPPHGRTIEKLKQESKLLTECIKEYQEELKETGILRLHHELLCVAHSTVLLWREVLTMQEFMLGPSIETRINEELEFIKAKMLELAEQVFKIGQIYNAFDKQWNDERLLRNDHQLKVASTVITTSHQMQRIKELEKQVRLLREDADCSTNKDNNIERIEKLETHIDWVVAMAETGTLCKLSNERMDRFETQVLEGYAKLQQQYEDIKLQFEKFKDEKQQCGWSEDTIEKLESRIFGLECHTCAPHPKKWLQQRLDADAGHSHYFGGESLYEE